MRLFHSTTRARGILKQQRFVDADHQLGLGPPRRGVALSSFPYDLGDRDDETRRPALFTVDLDIPDDQLKQFEARNSGEPVRIFVIPADVLAKHATVRRFKPGDDDVSALDPELKAR